MSQTDLMIRDEKDNAAAVIVVGIESKWTKKVDKMVSKISAYELVKKNSSLTLN